MVGPYPGWTPGIVSGLCGGQGAVDVTGGVPRAPAPPSRINLAYRFVYEILVGYKYGK